MAETPSTPAADVVDELEAALDAEEAQLLAIEREAFTRAWKKPTIANRSAWDKARDELEGFRRSRRESDPAVRIFVGLPEVLEYLEEEKWKVSKTSLYDHAKAGKLRPDAEGHYHLTAVMEYARCHLQKLDGTRGAEDSGVSLQEQKLREETDRIRYDKELRRIKYHKELGEWIPRADVESELAKRAAFLRSDLKNVFRAMSPEIVKIVNGDPLLIPALISWGVPLVDVILDRYARPIQGMEDE